MVFEDRISVYPGRYTMTDENGNVTTVILERADEPTVEGTPLNADTFNSMQEEIQIESEEYPGCFYRMIDGQQHWINPPMIPWKNYLTTEKFDGKYVYVVASDYPMEESSGTESFAFTNSFLSHTGANVVSVEGAVVDVANMVSYPLNNYDHNGGYCNVSVAGSRVDVAHTAVYAAMNVRMKVKYVVG